MRAAESGVVAYAGNEVRGFGNMLLLKHADGWVTAYAHNQELLVRRGDRVQRGQVIARVGSTGSVDRPQLHFEIRKGKQAVDPLEELPRPSAAARGRDCGLEPVDQPDRRRRRRSRTSPCTSAISRPASRFYRRFCELAVVHERSAGEGASVVWLAESGREHEFIFVLLSGGRGRDPGRGRVRPSRLRLRQSRRGRPRRRRGARRRLPRLGAARGTLSGRLLLRPEGSGRQLRRVLLRPAARPRCARLTERREPTDRLRAYPRAVQ